MFKRCLEVSILYSYVSVESFNVGYFELVLVGLEGVIDNDLCLLSSPSRQSQTRLKLISEGIADYFFLYLLNFRHCLFRVFLLPGSVPQILRCGPVSLLRIKFIRVNLINKDRLEVFKKNLSCFVIKVC